VHLDSLLWVALVTTVLLFDLVLGVAIGWRLGRSAGERSQAAASRARLDRTLRSMHDLTELSRVVSHQTGNYIAVTKQIGAELAQLPEGVCPSKIAGLLGSQRTIQSELEQRQAQFNQHVEKSQAALTPNRRARDNNVSSWHIELLDSLVRRRSADPASWPLASDPNRSTTDGAATGPRRDLRQPYHCPQFVAPYSADRIPPRDSFQEVECVDISNRGIAFLSLARPASETIIITTGDEPNVVYRTARIVHVQEVQNGDGTQFRVGCEFIGRLSRHLF
jgi:hypothetical protein